MTELVLEGNNKAEVVEALVERDGYKCQYPGCNVEFSAIPDHKWSITIDHIYPQARGKEDGWTYEEINGLPNLQLMHKACNARKSDLTYNDDGTLPIRGKVKTPKAQRPMHCDLCENGRLLLLGEVCELCGSDPQPRAFPKYLQKEPKECDHFEYHCWGCVTGILAERRPASAGVFSQR